MDRILALRPVIILIFFMFAVFGPGGVGSVAAKPPIAVTAADENSKSPVTVDLSSANELIEFITKNTLYQQHISVERLEEAVLKGIVSSLDDPYAAVVDTQERNSNASSAGNNTADLGLIIGEDTYKRPIVQSVLPGSPAEDAGIRPGERILRIGTVNVSGHRSWEIMSLLTSGASGYGKTVDIVVEPSREKPRHVILERRRYEVTTVELRIGGIKRTVRRPHRFVWQDDPEGEIAWIKVNSFLHDRTREEWSRMIHTIRSRSSVRRIVLDLRDNGGGDNSCISLLGDFFLHGETLVEFECLIGERHWSERIHNTETPRSRLISYPAVVLVNNRTASLAEIAAAALRDNRSVPLVGETTFGKGTTQTWIKAGDHYAVHLTIGRWLSPGGYSVEGKGLIPDIAVADDPTTVYIDDQLITAAKILISEIE